MMYRVSPLWPSKSQHKKYVGSPQYSEAPVYRRHRDRSQQTTTSAPAPIIERTSRVMKTDSSDSLLQQRLPLPPSPPPPPPPPESHRLHNQLKLPDGEVVVSVYQVHTTEMSAVSYGSCSLTGPQ